MQPSLPNIPFVKLNAIQFAYASKLILECFLLMVRFLIANVLGQWLDMLGTDRERAVSALPLKIALVG